MLTGTIYEYSEWPNLGNLSDEVPLPLMAEGERIRKVHGNKIVYEHSGLQVFSYGLGGIWVSLHHGKKCSEHFIDVYEKGLRYETEKIKIGNRYWQGTRCFYFEKKKNGSYLTIHDYKSGEIFALQSPQSTYFLSANEKYIVGQNRRGNVSCFNMKSEIVWEKKSKEKRMTMGRYYPYPYLFKNIVITNLGMEKQSWVNGTITAFDAATGHEVWTRVFSSQANSIAVDDKVYVAHKGSGVVLDAATGTTLLEIVTGIEKEKFFDDVFGPAGKYLYFFSYQESGGCVLLFDKNSGELKQSIDLPQPYVQLPGKYPYIWKDEIYISVLITDCGLTGSAYGLLVLKEAEEGTEPGISIEPRPEYVVLTVTEKNGEAYHVIINDTD